jgi:hypothetical protein
MIYKWQVKEKVKEEEEVRDQNPPHQDLQEQVSSFQLEELQDF